MNNSYVRLWEKKYSIQNTFEIELYNLSGKIPNQIFKLRNLRFLKLKGGSLSGSIPSDISNLNQLSH